MSETRDGGPAFPRPASTPEENQVIEQDGMSLRDYFAGQALSSVLQDVADEKQLGGMAPKDAAAKLAYIIADAMIRAREGGTQ